MLSSVPRLTNELIFSLKLNIWMNIYILQFQTGQLNTFSVFKRKLVMGVMSIFYQVLKLSLPQDNERTPA